jgi:hypothetical protein
MEINIEKEYFICSKKDIYECFCGGVNRIKKFIMEIAEIKQRLSLSEVIRHYGLKADKQNPVLPDMYIIK